MPTTITVATFNAENLFTRFKFKGKRVKNPPGSAKKYRYVPYTPTELEAATAKSFVIDTKAFSRTMEDVRLLTAKALKAVRADIVGLQEVENLDTLKLFNSRYMRSRRFPYQYLIDGNDPRLIDVGLLSRYEIDFLRTHQFTKSGRSGVFSRDCLEAYVRIAGGTVLPVLVNHFKSMMGGRAQTKARREGQVEEMIDILKGLFGTNYGDSDFVVVGDLNDYMEDGLHSESSIRKLLTSSQMENVVDRLPKDQRWTHYYHREKSYHQLDYILISRSLARKNPTVKPVIERRGQPLRVNRPGQPKRVSSFFPEVKKKLKASDHCPVAITLKV